MDPKPRSPRGGEMIEIHLSNDSKEIGLDFKRTRKRAERSRNLPVWDSTMSNQSSRDFLERLETDGAIGGERFESYRSNNSKDIVTDFKRLVKEDRPRSLPVWDSTMSHPSRDSFERLETAGTSQQRGGEMIEIHLSNDSKEIGLDFKRTRKRAERSRNLPVWDSTMSNQSSRDFLERLETDGARGGERFESYRSNNSKDIVTDFKRLVKEDRPRSLPVWDSTMSHPSRDSFERLETAGTSQQRTRRREEPSRSLPVWDSTISNLSSRDSFERPATAGARGGFETHRSNDSKDIVTDFKRTRRREERSRSLPAWDSNMTHQSRDSFERPATAGTSQQRVKYPRPPQRRADKAQIFKRLEEEVVSFARAELQRFWDVLDECAPVVLQDGDEQKQRSSEAVLKISQYFLRAMGQEALAQQLHDQIHYPEVCRSKLKSSLKRRCGRVYEGIAKAGRSSPLPDVYTDLHLTEPHSEDSKSIPLPLLFGPLSSTRTVMTQGEAGAGKSLLTQKFCLDWAEGIAARDVQLLFPFTFRELNVLRDARFSLVTLLHHFFSETKKTRLRSFDSLNVVFILDGLDESLIPLDFSESPAISDVEESASLGELLVNLLRGDLLPWARVWVIGRPAAVGRLPARCVSKVTEVRGFSEEQREAYFRGRFRSPGQASAVLSHIRSSPSLYGLCRLPLFSWILATVLLHVLQTGAEQLPQTLTEMYIHFLVVQTKQRSLKYEGRSESDVPWSPETCRTVRALGKLAFQQLRAENRDFYESDLSECGLDPAATTLYSGVFTQVFREESGLYQDQVFRFVHDSVQVFLAALHVHLSFFSSGVNLLSEEPASILSVFFRNSGSERFYQTAVDQMLGNPSRELNLFTRFLLGLSVPSNQELLRGMLGRPDSGPRGPQKTAEYLLRRLEEGAVSVERSEAIFHCLSELKERRLVEQMEHVLTSGRPIGEGMSQSQWAAVVFLLLSSHRQDVFELKKYGASEDVLRRLLPVVQTSSQAVLSGCDLTEKSCEALCVMFTSRCSLTHLDLSFNPLGDPGLRLLALALRSPHCRLQHLRLAGCHLTQDGCLFLVSALKSVQNHLSLLDLSRNHPGASAVLQLCGLQGAPHFPLQTLILRPAGAHWLRPKIRYFTRLTLDPNTAHRHLQLSRDLTRARHVQQNHAYADGSARFDKCPQLLCTQELHERSYWELEWTGKVTVGLCYPSLTRKGNTSVCGFGMGPDSWGLTCTQGVFVVTHQGKHTLLGFSGSSRGRVAVYVDVPAGLLEFYAVTKDKDEPVLLHTFRADFAQPLVPGLQLLFGSSVKLCDLEHEEHEYLKGL